MSIVDVALDLALRLLNVRFENTSRSLCLVRDELGKCRSSCLEYARYHQGEIRTPHGVYAALLRVPIRPEQSLSLIPVAEQAAREEAIRLRSRKDIPRAFADMRFDIVWLTYYDNLLSGVQEQLSPRFFFPTNNVKRINLARCKYEAMKQKVRVSTYHAIAEARKDGRLSEPCILKEPLLTSLEKVTRKSAALTDSIERSINDVRHDILSIVDTEARFQCQFPNDLFERFVILQWRDYLLSYIENIFVASVA